MSARLDGGVRTQSAFRGGRITLRASPTHAALAANTAKCSAALAVAAAVDATTAIAVATFCTATVAIPPYAAAPQSAAARAAATLGLRTSRHARELDRDASSLMQWAVRRALQLQWVLCAQFWK